MARKASIPSRDDHAVDDEKATVTSQLDQLADESVEAFELNDATGSEAGSDTGESSTSNEAGRMDGNGEDRESDKRDKEQDMESRPSVEELRERLTQKIRSLRAARKAPGSGIPGAPLNREGILKARKAKEQHRKEVLKRKRAAEEEVKQLADDDGKLITKPTSAETNDIDTSSAVFSKVTLKSGEVIAANGEIQSKKRKKGPVDLLGQLKHVEAKKARIATMDKDKRATVEEKEKWRRAIKQMEGDKVQDDEKMLKKSLKKQLKRKRKSAKEWKEREDNVLKGIKARQKKREENIAARKEMKTKGKKSKGKSPAKKKKRPGFEGGIKRKRK
ncbi:surfeit locus protein 6-domain-containing protein [Lipomyces orientalis]|uniref:Surfeit locus protein 6-domain-containing protein n=1 Tax=Lipomyces orientalis TaxID=1233043 RepID=A0ACC3TF47_9ASCO